jgi:hypothetical protein
MRRVVAVAIVVGVLGGWTGDAWADGFPGRGALTGRAKLKVRPCGKAVSDVGIDVVVDADGAWTIDDGEVALAGTGVVRGKARRKLVLELDEPGRTALAARLEAEAGTLCDMPVTATAVTVRKARLKVNAKIARARLVVLLTATGTADDGTGGKARYRVVAHGPWSGPLSCAQIYDCTQACSGDDAACDGACLARGTVETQDAVVALDACVDAACPQTDSLCVAEALAGACRDEYETCVPPPPPSELGCEQILDCANACGGSRCVDDCFERGSTRGREEATAVSSCVGRVCPNGGAGCQTSALAGACAYVWEDCTGTPPPQHLSCRGILDCMVTCPSGDAGCLADCEDRGSTAGRAALTTLNACIDAACPTRDAQCVASTVTGQCKTQWETCLG